MNISKPIIYEVDYNKTTVDDLRDEVQNKFNENDSSFLLNYPVVYIIHDEKTSNFSVYIGETSDIIKRTNQHLLADLDKKPFWKEFANSKTSKMYFIGQEHFNKSLTLDVENRFMHYLSSVPSVKHIYNARTNEQRDYYTSSELDVNGKIKMYI
jgi:predicted GIY-YIG superfamily endonuclease